MKSRIESSYTVHLELSEDEAGQLHVVVSGLIFKYSQDKYSLSEVEFRVLQDLVYQLEQVGDVLKR